MKIQIGRLAWIPRSEISPEREVSLRTNLIFDFTEDGGGVVRLFEDRDDAIGIPRVYGLSEFPELEVEDVCASTQIDDWPELTFPPGKDYRQGQKKSIDRIFKVFDDGKYGALLEAHTGSGKTLMATAIASQLKQPTLVVVHKNDLAEQWQNTFEEFFPGIRVGHCQGKKWDYEDKHIVTAMAQTIFSQKDITPTSFYNKFGMVIFDEGHRYPARTFEQVMRCFPARYRLAVSATWRRKDDLECIWHWHVGTVEHRLVADQLVGEYKQINWATNIQDRMFYQKYGRFGINTARYITSISRNAPYNRWLAHQVVLASGVDRRVLLVSDRVEQCLKIRELILSQCSGVTVGLYVGAIDKKAVKKEDRDKAKECDIVLATYGMMSEGTDIPELDTLFFATPRSDIEQVVGRIQRPNDTKKQLLIIDPVFQTKYNKALAAKRRTFYKKLGFKSQPDEE